MSDLRVLLGVPWYFPDSAGGTETYVRGLARRLRESGVQVGVASPACDLTPTSYVHDGIPVFRYPAPESAFGEIDPERPSPRGWCDVLDAFAPTVVDLHSLTSALELAHLKAAHHRGARTVVTLHVPGVICARETFMRFGKTPCSGDLAEEPCTACRLEADGIPQPIGRLLGSVPAALGEGLGSRLSGMASRALMASLRDASRREWLEAIIHHADRIVAASDWLVDVLKRNGAPAEKVVLCRQGADLTIRKRDRSPADTTLRVGFVGRYDPVKGLHVLIDAVHQMPADARIQVHVWGIARTPQSQSYRDEMVRRANADSRVIFHEESADPVTVYRQIDVLAVPSVWLETGPLVVLEAQAAGLPIVGSNLGGIAERVTDGRDGLLVPFGRSAELAEALMYLAADRSRVEALRPQVLPRSMTDVAAETLQMYRTLLVRESADALA